MEPLVCVEGTLKESDLLSAARFVTWKRSASMKFMLGLGCLMLLIGIGGFAIGQGRGAAIPLLLGAFYTAYLLLSPKLTIRRQMKSSPHLSQVGRYEFGADEFSISRPSLNVSMPWSNVHSVVELRDVFAIFTTRMCFFAVPKRFFDAAQLDTFRSLMQSASGRNGRPLCPSRGRQASTGVKGTDCSAIQA